MPVQAEGEAYVKQIEDGPIFECTKARFPTWKKNFLLCLHCIFEIFTAGVVDVSSLMRECLSLRCNKTSPEETPRSTYLCVG